MVEKLGMRRRRKKVMMGFIMGEINELLPKSGKIKIKSKIIPNRPRNMSTILACLSGKIPIKIFSPSNGLTGIKLNMARTIFISIKK